ncbi:potassium-transporting ATPase subunit KdpA [Cupriavidus oxalaticus]|uniref:Potassium-transporting ATPase potassium-binding subunit n=1 Tax=Cupriavidus oxalaticus TaxID=96344 RepID=A0A375G027_9BURK|nr:potassium-transporting ATPase subunit KdpA [Cupriavidus oxalaticus]QRQ85916.1 potassium-transporting ATPase subunit KdpA [Cupriavidus oxalaticus]QRQ95758.1 potassium-transporting ATPase subunit KdpA [Cupriavidus oxalaticus]WQD84424.1 potassium-transporting ATPase subunit KdpA [Cupriavidus oxalaticus]SPC06680.1 P-type ATPase, high-affinity potassium transport system, A chain [Cupriavidus oxalaticus]SPC12335.1 potassium translocating ATPase, subunit A [Cupriavidus oxalaticus]
MNTSPFIQLGLYLVALFALAWPLGRYLTAVMDGRLSVRYRWLGAFERGICRSIGTSADEDMPWWRYATAIVLFNLLGVIAVYALQRLQGGLPLNPAGVAAVEPGSAFNTAVSFTTNTNWQGYSGESTMSYLTQMLALTVQNFVSAATAIAVVVAMVRGFVRRSADGIGNAWLDLGRATGYVLLPLSFLLAVFLAGQGVIQNFDAYQDVKLIEPVAYQQQKHDANGKPMADAAGKPVMETLRAGKQTIAMGPVASQEAIKMVGTNGGGFFNANSAHPYENPNGATNFVEMLAILLIPAALCFMFGAMVGDMRQGVAVVAAMTVIFVAMFAMVQWSEMQANPLLPRLGVDGMAGNLEGKETRFGITASSLFATITTAASCGAVNSMHDSLMPLGGLAPMLQMQLGEVVFGGVGSGLYGMLVFAILAVFLAGLMIGRTPEYLGKKIESYEMKMVSAAILITPLLVLGGTAVSVLAKDGLAGILNPGAHGFSEVLYAFSSAANNNGSAFAGLSANTPYYNLLLALAMWFGRFVPIVAVLAIAGSLARKPRLAVSSGTMPTHGALFVLLLVGTVMMVGALTYIPALALGPMVEQLQLFAH